MTLLQRVEAYAARFPNRPPLQIVTEGAGAQKHTVLYGQFVIGNDYSASVCRCNLGEPNGNNSLRGMRDASAKT